MYLFTIVNIIVCYSEYYSSMVLNRGARAHKGSSADFQGALKMTSVLKWDKMSIEMH